ncbi:MAG: choice-of-anchor tandem repeat GloVer-containing protein [Candidatus Sulfotelmatobacter sp.]
MKSELIPPTESHNLTVMQSATKTCKRWCLCALGLAIVLGPMAVPPLAQGQTFTVLYAFTGGTDGSSPNSVIIDAAGNLYGTTEYGGTLTSCNGSGCGVVFKLDTTGMETVLHRFGRKGDGELPFSGVIRDAAGNLYGTTVGGGSALFCFDGCGAVFKLDVTGNETALHSFSGRIGGADPDAGVIRDAAGNLYGTTSEGGDLTGGSPCSTLSGCGVVFKLDPTGKETVLYSFTGGVDGAGPTSGVVRDTAGNLYGTTVQGGDLTGHCAGADTGCGVVFKLDTAGKETVQYSFTGGGDGYYPFSGVIRDAAGNLYGTASGGAFDSGTVFKLDNTGKLTVLYSFTGGVDGFQPNGVIRDAAGNLYGTTAQGGDTSCGNSVSGCGLVFKLDPTGQYTVLYSFTHGADGSFPDSLIMDAAGNLYGTTEHDGDPTCSCGTVFKIAP